MSLSRYLKQDTDKKKKKAPKTNFHITDNNFISLDLCTGS